MGRGRWTIDQERKRILDSINLHGILGVLCQFAVPVSGKMPNTVLILVASLATNADIVYLDHHPAGVGIGCGGAKSNRDVLSLKHSHILVISWPQSPRP